MNEEFVQYKKLGITVLAKALDDICPTFNGETEEDKQLKIEERIKFYEQSERELDKEWDDLVSELVEELATFNKERDIIFSKISKTNNSEKVKTRITNFETKKKARVEYLQRKMDRELEVLNKKLSEFDEGSKKRIQISNKITELQNSTTNKIKKTELRYNTIIKNTINSDNSERVDNRLQQSKEVWNRKYLEMSEKYNVKTIIHNNRSMELDQIRIALDGFINEVDSFRHWCTLADVTLKDCYIEAINRAKMVKRDTTELEGVLTNIIAGVL